MRVGHELVDHQVHLPQLPRTEVLSASFVLQEDWGGREMRPCEAWPRGPLTLTPEFGSLVNTSVACNGTLAPDPVLGD